nr:hypothetical protein [Tanacetum cinerariifolium]
MASAVICISKGQRFNFSRVGKGCPGIETPLFENMLEIREEDAEEEVQVSSHDHVDQENVIEEIADDVAQPTSPLPSSPIVPPLPPRQSLRVSPSQATEGTSILVQQVLDKYSALIHRVEGLESANTAQQLEILKLKARVKKLERLNKVKGRQADTQAKIYNIDLDHTSKVLSVQEDSKVQEVVEVVNVAKLMTEVATTAASIPIPAVEPVVAAVSTPISAATPKGVVIRDTEEELHNDTPVETQSAKDKGKGILVEDPKPMKKKDQIAMDAEYVRKLQEEEESLAQTKDAQATDSKEEMEKEEEEEIIKSINKTPAQKAAKRRRLHEQAKEAKDLKKQLEVVADEDDDVFVEATPIGTKVPVVNYEVVMINNKPRYKILRADDTPTLKNMFEKTDAQDVLWRSQQTEHGQALVKSWKLLTSCGVHIITFTTTMFILLVEKKYPLSRPKENTKCVSAADEELTAAKNKLKLLV